MKYRSLLFVLSLLIKNIAACQHDPRNDIELVALYSTLCKDLCNFVQKDKLTSEQIFATVDTIRKEGELKDSLSINDTDSYLVLYKQIDLSYKTAQSMLTSSYLDKYNQEEAEKIAAQIKSLENGAN